MTFQSAPYAHRRTNGLFASICRTCYRTVAVEMSEEYLAEEENLHLCEEKHTILFRLLLPIEDAKPN